MLCLNYYCVLYLGWLVQLTLLVVFQFYISIKPPLLPDEFKKGLDLCLKKLRQRGHVTIVTSSFSKNSVFKIFSIRKKRKSRFGISSV